MKLRNSIFYVKDIKKSKRFYKKIGFEIAQDFGKFVSYKTSDPEVYFSIMESDGEDKVPGKQSCSVWTSTIEDDFKFFKGKGVEFAEELQEFSFGKGFHIRDIDGNKIEFVSR